MPEGLWLSCPSCKNMLYKKTIDENLGICTECEHHFRLDGATRVGQLVDEGSFEEIGADLASSDPLEFEWGEQQYKDRIQVDPSKMNAHEAMLAGKIDARQLVTVAEITTTMRGLAAEVPLDHASVG